MRAVVIRDRGGPEVLGIEERPDPQAGPDQIVVRVRAAGLNRADLLQRRGAYPAPAGVPADIPGLEYAGEVESVGSGVRRWAPGDRVMGIVGGGAQAERVVVHEAEALPVPSALTLVDAAAVPEAFVTAFDALALRLHVVRGETLLVHAVGSGVGTAAVQLAREFGLRTIGTSRTREKLDRALALGLDHAVLASSYDDWRDPVLHATEGRGVDAVLDLVGGPYVATNLRVLRTGGRIAVVGLVAGARVDLDLRALLRTRATLVGTVLRSRGPAEKADLARRFEEQVLPLFESRNLTPVREVTLPFDAVAEAHRQMEDDDTFGKVVLAWDT